MLEAAKRCARLVGQGVDKHGARIDLVCHTFAAFTILARQQGTQAIASCPHGCARLSAWSMSCVWLKRSSDW